MHHKQGIAPSSLVGWLTLRPTLPQFHPVASLLPGCGHFISLNFSQILHPSLQTTLSLAEEQVGERSANANFLSSSPLPERSRMQIGKPLLNLRSNWLVSRQL